MLTYRVNTQMLGVVRSCVGVRMCHGTDRPEQKQVEINRVDTEVLSTRILYTCFVRCVGVCVCCACVWDQIDEARWKEIEWTQTCWPLDVFTLGVCVESV